MATTSQIKNGLDQIAAEIKSARDLLILSKQRIASARNTLDNLPTTYAAVITAIDALPGTGAFETLVKDEKSKLATEFTALKNKALTAETDLNAIDFTV